MMGTQRNLFICLCFIACFLFSTTSAHVHAEVLRSNNFQILDPVIGASGGRSTSTNFILLEALSQFGLGTSSSATSYTLNPGFLSFSAVTIPTVTATAGDGQVSLSWTIAAGSGGWTVSGYTVGQSTTSGGPYTYTSVSSTTSSTRTGLTNGTTYYFILLPEDAFGNRIATSTEVSALPASSATSPSPGSSGGGGGAPIVPSANVTFLGKAYPHSKVILLKDAQIAVSTVAGTNANFEISLSGLSSGTYMFSLYGEDNQGLRSQIQTFPITLSSGSATKIEGIFITPTVALDKREVRRGDNVTIFGQTVPEADIIISVHSDEEIFLKTTSEEDGSYVYHFDTSVIEYGDHAARSKSVTENFLSNWSYLAHFKVGIENKAWTISSAPARGDLNNDSKVNLIDFSIAAFWYKRGAPPISIDLNSDGVIDLIDFSILAYYWTG